MPLALSSLAGTELDNSSNVLMTPDLHSDVIGKIDWDPAAGYTANWPGWSARSESGIPTLTCIHDGRWRRVIECRCRIAAGLRTVTNNYWSSGGRYLFGQASDVLVRADGSLSPIDAAGTVDGLASRSGKWLLYGYYGRIYVRRNVAINANESQIGYGFSGSPGSQNRTLQETTMGFNETIWRNSRYGALNLMGQYEYALRNPGSTSLRQKMCGAEGGT